MGRGKIEIKKIENATNRQVTYSKRRNGIFKKAQEPTVLCDAKVSLIMFSHPGRFHEFISPSTTTKKIIDEYQNTSGTDLWITHYEYHVIKTQKETYRKKVRNLEHIHGDLLLDFEAKCDDPHYGLVDDEGDYESAIALANVTSNLYPFRLHHGHPALPNLHHGGGFGPHELRLA